MPCDYERISAWIDGEITDGEEIKVIEEHLHACKDCRQMAASFRRLSVELQGDFIPPMSEQLVDEIAVAIPDRPRRLSFWQGLMALWHMRIAIPAPAFACLLLALCAALYWRGPISASREGKNPKRPLVLVEYGRSREPVVQRAHSARPQTYYQLRPVENEYVAFPPPPPPNYGVRRLKPRRIVIEETFVPPAHLQRGERY